MENHNREHQTGGKRLEEKPKSNVKKHPKQRLTASQKALIAIAVVLALILMAVLAWKSIFVRPDIEKKPVIIPDSPDAVEVIDYGGGVRPKAEGQRKSEDFYTVLILGRDTGGGGNTDTMLLASYDVTNQKASVMSIPRDTMVNVGWDVKKINSVYNVYGGGEKGIQSIYKEVAQLVGFEPDFRVVVEWEAVGKLVDAIGGVWFDVPYQMDYHDPYQDLIIEQDKGYRLLNGDDAMQVIRWRKNDVTSPYGNPNVGDSGRMEIQQSFLKAVIHQMMQPSNVKNISKIANVFQETVETDLSLQNILWFGQQAFTGGLSMENISFFTMPYKGAFAWSRTYRQNLDYVIPRAEELLRIVNDQLSPFAEVFTLKDLDIMFVNTDGSVGSTTGHVEDTKAALPPEKPDTKPETGEGSGSGEAAPNPEENVPVTDPETGPIADPAEGEGTDDPEAGGTTSPETTLPEAGESTTPAAGGTEPEEPGAASPADEPPAPQEPSVPQTDEPTVPPEAE